ncbi:mannosyl-glycoprotein endo-beta-N-acetylglucosaminidase [Limosilactobacillus oris F0423]|uniref:Mannosyl-glycoprotein endo-beta-N-acetylglucosaminidase n=1 Tax=Limosilactobacillus oris F0423 TaxID=944562 RepID=A0ABN0D4I6_9LACO|nr:glucosaminidase domain-containing protein [Limosilactobacillus oris]EGS36427.1 mannosyl-glycoprotein endo-beta-N-acetylglucosaminidase [Limosilactobacillus oris F0423]
MKNKKQSRVKIVLPVLFTFGASLLFFQADAQADSSQSADANAQVVATTDANTQNNNSQSLNVSTSQNQSVASAQVYTQSAVAANQTTNNSNDDGAVSLDNSAVQAAANKPVVETNPGYSTSQYNVTAEPVNAANGGSGAASLNTAGLTAAQKAFLDSIHDGAISTWKQYGVLPSLTAAQAIIESGWGQSSLASQYHNLFGIKGSYNGHSVTLPTREVYGGQSVIINDAFRAYDNNSQSVQDHGYFLVANSRYHNLLWKTNYRDVTYLIRADGYATDPSYTTTLNSVIERYGLTAWDQEAFDTNTGHVDDLSVRGDQLHISGWHVASASNSNMHHFIILLDGNTDQELYRQDVSKTYRQDIQNLYSNTGAAGWSGFDITIPYTSTFAGRNIKVVSRYTNDAKGDPNGGKDLSFNSVSLNANMAALDNMSLDATTGNINISGWHAADNSLGKKYHYIIIFDGSKQTELGRYLVNSVTRNDVARAFPGLYNAANSGFSLKLKFSSALAGDQIQVISRYTDDPAGNGNAVDYWFAPKTFNQNRAYLENFKVSGNQVHISGWHASDQSVGKKYHYIIVFDKSKGKEITRYRVENKARTDITRAYSNIYNAGQSGFDINVPLTAGMVGDQIQVISRYTDDPAGNGNVVDYWFAPQTFNQNLASLDQVAVKNNQLDLAGWHATDQGLNKPYHFIILYDWTTGKEVERQLVENVARPDVANAFAVYNAGQSGFKVSLPVDSSLSGHRLQVISRYSDSASGEGNHIDYWFEPLNVTIK